MAQGLLTADKVAFNRIGELNADLFQFLDILLRQGVAIHLIIHGGRQKNWTIGGQDHGACKIIGETPSDPGNKIGRGGSHQNQIGKLGQRGVDDIVGRVDGEKVIINRFSAHRTEGKGGYKFLRRLGQNTHHPGPLLPKRLDEIGDLVSSDASRNNQKDRLIFESRFQLFFA